MKSFFPVFRGKSYKEKDGKEQFIEIKTEGGLTKREFFIGCALIGFTGYDGVKEDSARIAIETADDVMALLEQEKI